MPFYIYPLMKSTVSFEDSVINFLDWMVDAHEDSRNKQDAYRNFHARTVYTYQNFFRLQNDTVANAMFETKATPQQYARLNSVVAQQNLIFYSSAAALHTLAFAGLSFLLRFRRVTLLPTVAAAGAYYCFFANANNILYKLVVDREVLKQARVLGLDHIVQPTGTHRPRGFNFS